MSGSLNSSCPVGPDLSCLISPDPDVAGIGVRVAIYLQALFPLVSIPFIPHSSIKTVDSHNLFEKYCKRGSGSLVAFSSTSAALLVAAIIKRAQWVLSPYHALVVLNLTWIILISSCCRAAMMYYLQSQGIPGSFAYRLTQCVRQHRGPKPPEDPEHDMSLMRDLSQTRPSWKSARHVSVLGFHVLAAGILGWMLFSDVDGFAGPGVCACPRETVLWVPSSFVRIADPSTRHFWMAIYVIALFSPITLAVIIFVACCTFNVAFVLVYKLAQKVSSILSFRRGKIMNALSSSSPSFAPSLRAFEMLAVALLVLLIVSTEKTIARNPVAEGEDAWGFGQTLALILTLSALYESVQDLRMSVKLPRTSTPWWQDLLSSVKRLRASTLWRDAGQCRV